MSTIYRYRVPIQKRICNINAVKTLLNEYGASLSTNKDFPVIPERSGGLIITSISTEDNHSISVCIALAPDKRKYKSSAKIDVSAVFVHSWDKVDVIRESLMFNLKDGELVFECMTNSPEIEEIQTPFIKFAFKKRIIGDAYGFRITRSPIHLRLEDAPKLSKMISNPSDGEPTVVLIRSSKGCLSDLVYDMCGVAAVMFIDDIDLIEELEEVHDLKHGLPDPETMWLIQDGDIVESLPYDEEGILNIRDLLIYGYNKMIDIAPDPTFVIADMAIDYLNNLSDLKEKTENKLDIAKATLNEKNSNDFAKIFTPVVKPQVIPAGSPVIVRGKEKDLYPDEIRDIVIDSLKEYRQKSVADGSRRAHILDDILECNKPAGALEEKRTMVKESLSKYEGMSSPKVINDLEKLGFKVKSTNKHIKAIWCGDSRYTNTIATTPGDGVCGSENLVHKVLNHCF